MRGRMKPKQQDLGLHFASIRGDLNPRGLSYTTVGFAVKTVWIEASRVELMEKVAKALIRISADPVGDGCLAFKNMW